MSLYGEGVDPCNLKMCPFRLEGSAVFDHNHFSSKIPTLEFLGNISQDPSGTGGIGRASAHGK